MRSRDEFSKGTKRTLAERVSTLCSNPSCGSLAYGPSSDPTDSTNTGVAAHIRAAAPGGPRYDPDMTPEERSEIDNGIWLCQHCAKMVDDDPDLYTVDVLLQWRARAEERARRAQENPHIVNFGPDFADTFLLVTRQRTSPRGIAADYKPGQRRRRKITIRPIRAKRDLLNSKMPLTLRPGLLEPGICLLNVSCQNQGTGVDQFVKMRINFEQPAITDYSVNNPNQVQLIGGGGSGASYAVFMVRALLPQEVQRVQVLARDGVSFDVSLWTERGGDSDEVFIYDVLLGPDERVSG